MDRLEAAKYIKDHCLGSEVYRDGTTWNDAMMTAVEALEGKDTNVPTKWIPFTQETAPKDGELYLIKIKTVTGSESIRTDRYSTAYGEWFIYENDIVKKWMPIPKDEGEAE